MKHIAIGIPHAGNTFSGEFLDSTIFMLSGWHGQFTFLRKKSALIFKARNQMFDHARNIEADYLLMIDSDIVFPSDAIKKLVAMDKDVCTGVYYQKSYPHRPCVYRWTGKDVDVHENYSTVPTEPFKVDSCGAGFLLISKKVLQEYKGRNPFNHILHGDDLIGEDTSFCMRMRDAGYEIWCDPTIRLGHIGDMVIQSEHWEAARKRILDKDRQDDGIDGWTSPEELKFLAESARNKTSIVEIGVWKGRSTKVLLEASEGFVHAVDHFKGTDKDGDPWSGILAKEQDVKAKFMENVGHYPNLRLHEMPSKEASMFFEDGDVDMVFIDGDHTYRGVKGDIDTWLPKIKKGGLICGHDYGVEWPGVVQAVNEKFKDVEVIGSIWYKKVA
jgi:predicted O-methyltransferase YrrM